MFANTVVAVYRDTDVDAYGDTLDDDRDPEPGLERVRAALTERSRTIFDNETGELRVLRVATLRVVAGTDIRPGDRVRDAASKRAWLVDGGPIGAPNAIGQRTLSFDLKGA